MPDSFGTVFNPVGYRGKNRDLGNGNTYAHTQPLLLAEVLGRLLPLSASFSRLWNGVNNVHARGWWGLNELIHVSCLACAWSAHSQYSRTHFPRPWHRTGLFLMPKLLQLTSLLYPSLHIYQTFAVFVMDSVSMTSRGVGSVLNTMPWVENLWSGSCSRQLFYSGFISCLKPLFQEVILKLLYLCLLSPLGCESWKVDTILPICMCPYHLEAETAYNSI